MSYPRSPQEKVGGLVYFGRMIDKIRLLAKGDLPADLQKNLGRGFDERCLKFLHVDYAALSEAVAGGLSDEEALQWCHSEGRQPSEEEIEVWNEFLRKCGWRDAISEILESRKKEDGFADRDDIQTMFEYIDADEGRLERRI